MNDRNSQRTNDKKEQDKKNKETITKGITEEKWKEDIKKIQIIALK